MESKEIVELRKLKEILKSNISPILTNLEIDKMFQDNIVVEANEINDLLEKSASNKPEWIDELNTKVLIIKNIDKITKKNQCKFIELLKYRKIQAHLLPKESRIVFTTSTGMGNLDSNLCSYLAYVGV